MKKNILVTIMVIAQIIKPVYSNTNPAFYWEDPAVGYIKKFAPIAQKEMSYSGIPASIKLAQAIVESEMGRSTLAVNSNNHFGIKCGSQWTGKSYYKVDDDKDENGSLIESCFRAFDTPEESFKAHSEFLTDPKKEKRYGFLFELAPTDYNSWARGLKDAGYASDPSYPDKLIKIIERYNLYKYDSDVNIDSKNSKREVVKDTKSSKSKLEEKSTSKNKNEAELAVYSISKINNKKSIKLKYSTTVEKLSKQLNLDIADIISYNEFVKSPSQVIAQEAVVFIEKKNKDYKGDKLSHKVVKSETVESISNLYGMRTKTLLSLNKIPKNHQPLEGQILRLSKKTNCSNPKTKEMEYQKKYSFD
jgi:LysM repeat protein